MADTVVQPGVRRRGRMTRSTEWVLGAGAILAVLAIWQVFSWSGVLNREIVPSAAEVLGELARLATTGGFWTTVGHTVSSALAGLFLVWVIGSALALVIGLIRPVEESTWLVIEFLKPIPPIALIPLGLLLWGPSPTMKITLITFGALWPFLTQVVYGIKDTNNVVLDMARSYRLGWWLTTTRIIVPSILPYALTGLRISASIAVIVSVVTELVGGARGIGQAITVTQVDGQLPAMYAWIITAGLLGVAINLIFTAVERPLLSWHPSQRGERS